MSVPAETSPTRCAAQWLASDRSAAGTAPVAVFWVALEQPGPWGRKAFTESRLDPAVGASLEKAVSDAGGRAVLVRRAEGRSEPGQARSTDALRSIFVATALDATPLLGRRLVAPHDVSRAIDDLLSALDAVAAGRLPAGFEPCDPVLLVCSNGKRDQCCAIESRPLLRDLARDDVWEATHLNGHRFAPTGVVLPTGQMGAWLDAADARAALSAAGTGQLWSGGAARERGRTHLPPAVQAVDVALRACLGVVGSTDLRYQPDADLVGASAASMVGRESVVQAEHRDGRRWRFVVTATGHDALPESCGKQAVPVAEWVVHEVPAGT